jgi:metabolite-proton symporter
MNDNTVPLISGAGSAAAAGPADPDRRRMMLRAVTASAVGTTIEWYDFFLYGVAAALVFPKIFFPHTDPFAGTILSFGTFFVGFVARPIGAALFGHYGDRIGRKSLLVLSMMLMGVATVGIGLIPDYESIGIWGAVLLTVGRVMQGLGVGGAWSGSVLMAGEWTDPKRRGLSTSFAQFGAPAGLVLANGALALTMVLMSEEEMLDWGWRIPFLASIALIFVGLWVRIGVLESPVFAKLKQQGKIPKAPIAHVLRHHWREVALTALLRTGQHIPFYIFSTYILSYGTQELGFSRGMVLSLVMLSATLSLFAIPLSGYLSDRFGRRRVTAVGCALMVVWPFLYFDMVGSGVLALTVLAIAISLPVHDVQYGPQAAFIAECFPASVRYTGSALGYQLASITAGGPAPILAALLYKEFGTADAIAIYMSLGALISLACVWALRHEAGELDER